MAGHPPTPRSGLARIASSLTALVAAPPCGICGRGHAALGWMIDPFGRVSGRCPGCIGEPVLSGHSAPDKVRLQ
jgi:hypothetical protein